MVSEDLNSRVSLFGKERNEGSKNAVAQYGHPRAAGSGDEIQELAR